MTDFTERFAFGANWQRFRATLDKRRIDHAMRSFMELLGGPPTAGQTMLDIGCGSGLSSLVARRLGLRVHGFDFDPDSVECSQAVRAQLAPGDEYWTIERGDVLDSAYLARLGTFDLVYSWGVLHHTGDMWRAIDNAARCVAPGGRLALAIYNDQGGASRRWRAVKRLYNRLPRALRPLLVAACIPGQWWKDILSGVLGGRPLQAWRDYSRDRGMSPWHDMVDWVGGYPFEVAKPEEIFEFMRARGFALERLKTCGGGIGCNEYVFAKI
ncbi:MAG: class I SAM-dependent methyltransferase [Pseudolabrys sp.]